MHFQNHDNYSFYLAILHRYLFYLQKIQDISSAISINQKFIFVKEFFGGKTDIYEELLDKMNNCHDFESAKKLFIETCFTGGDFLEKSEQKNVKEMIELLERRFTSK